MTDIVGKFFAIIFGAVILFIMPVMVICLKQDNTIQSYIDNAVVEFVDNARASAQITPEGYMKLVDRVDTASPCCNIDITYYSNYISPDVSHKNAEDKYDYKYHLYAYNMQEILQNMTETDGYFGKTIYMNDGDYIKVVVNNEGNPTLGTKILNFFLTDKSDMTIYSSYGGYVGNNI